MTEPHLHDWLSGAHAYQCVCGAWESERPSMKERGWLLAQSMADASKAYAATRRPPKARYIEVIEVVFRRGDGVEGDPVREVTAYYAADGAFLAEHDPS